MNRQERRRLGREQEKNAHRILDATSHLRAAKTLTTDREGHDPTPDRWNKMLSASVHYQGDNQKLGINLQFSEYGNPLSLYKEIMKSYIEDGYEVFLEDLERAEKMGLKEDFIKGCFSRLHEAIRSYWMKVAPQYGGEQIPQQSPMLVKTNIKPEDMAEELVIILTEIYNLRAIDEIPSDEYNGICYNYLY